MFKSALFLFCARLCYLDQLHDEVQLAVGVHLFNEKNNVGVLHSSQDGHLILNHVFLRGGEREGEREEGERRRGQAR